MKADVSPQTTGRAEPQVRIEHARKVFAARTGASEFVALDDVNLAIAKGSIQAVIGRSGAGKSTLIRLVNGLEKPTSGRVLVGMTEVSALGERELRLVRQNIGMIFQHFNLLSSRTVFDNVALPLEIAGFSGDISGRVMPLLDLVGLADKRDRYPAELSGGQKQRVGIARALATRPDVLLSDEATSALDPETTEQILALLRQVNAEFNLTVLLITHEMAVVKAVADRVAVLEAGKVVEEGDTFDIFVRPRHTTTRSFLGTVTGTALPSWIRSRLGEERIPGGSTLIRIIFSGENAPQPVLTRLARRLDVDVNILSGQVDEISGKPFGTLVVAVPSNPETERRIRAELTELDLIAEIIGHVA